MTRESYEPFIDCVFPFSPDGSNRKHSPLYQLAQKTRAQEAKKNYLSRDDHCFAGHPFVYFHRRCVDEIFTHKTRYHPNRRRDHPVYDLFKNDLSPALNRAKGPIARVGAIHRAVGHSLSGGTFGLGGCDDFRSARIGHGHDGGDFDRLGIFFDHSARLFVSTKTSRFSGHSCHGKAHGLDFDSDRCSDVLERGRYVHERWEGLSYKLIVAYDGTRYFGWQKTKTGPTIQGEIEKACGQILQGDVLSEAASRTDRGVHARGQVVQILCAKEMAPRKLIGALNSKLPPDIRVLEAEQTDPDFHVTLDSLAKTYSYHINLGAGRDPFLSKFAWHYLYAIDLEKMRAAAHEIVGKRNFAAFTTLKTTDGMRHLYKIKIDQVAPNCLRIDLTGDRFLYKMARTIAGTLADIGSGKMDAGVLLDLFTTGTRPLAGVTAPAHGLTLQRIYYSKEKLWADIIQ